MDLDIFKGKFNSGFWKNGDIPFDYDTKEYDELIVNDLVKGNHPKLIDIKRSFIDKTVCVKHAEIPKSLGSLSIRKQHEVSQIYQMIQSQDYEFIIDVGSGDSYLTNLLLLNQYKIISIERDIHKISQSVKRLNRLGIPQHNVFHLNDISQLNNDNIKLIHFIKSLQSSNIGIPKALIIGMNSCGDLSNEIITFLCTNNFHHLEIINYIITPCCLNKTTYGLISQYEQININNHDLTFLTNDEIINEYEKSYTNLSFDKWCFVNGFMTSYIENYLINDKLTCLSNHGFTPKTKVIFDFNISSRNICITENLQT